MGTIFVAYGETDQRQEVLKFAVEQAGTSEHDLFVYHVRERADEETSAIEDEIATVVDRIAPEITFEVGIETRDAYSDRTNVSKVKRLTDAILDADQSYEYVVMGNHERSRLEELTLPSMTKAALETHAVPVVLVPV